MSSKLTRQDLIERLKNVGYTSLSRLRKGELEQLYLKMQKQEEKKEEKNVTFRETVSMNIITQNISTPSSISNHSTSSNITTLSERPSNLSTRLPTSERLTTRRNKKPDPVYFEEEFEKLRNTEISKYTKIVQLGQPGKEGTTYLVMDPIRPEKRYAMKCFRRTKSENRLAEEAHYQWIVSKAGLAPKVYEFNPREKYILMEALDRTLLNILHENHGKFPESLQQKVIDLYKQLDETGVAVNDGNPRNIMEKNGKLYMIDYGLAKFSNSSSFRKYPTPNMTLLPNALFFYIKEKFDTRDWTLLRKLVPAEALREYDRSYLLKHQKR